MEALNEIVAIALRWGFWKCYDRLRHLGRPWNHKRVHHVYCEMRLHQIRRTKKRIPKRERDDLGSARISAARPLVVDAYAATVRAEASF